MKKRIDLLREFSIPLIVGVVILDGVHLQHLLLKLLSPGKSEEYGARYWGGSKLDADFGYRWVIFACRLTTLISMGVLRGETVA